MTKLKFKDYDVIVILASGTNRFSGNYLEVPKYINAPKKTLLDADHIFEYFKKQFNKHKRSNPDFLEKLGTSIGLFLKKTPLLGITIEQEVNLTRAFELFKQFASPPINSDHPLVGPSLVWNGQQKEFAELLEELQRKNWIEKISDGNLRPIIVMLTKCFDLSNTRKSQKSNIVDSIYQIMKPSEKDLKITTKRYDKKFDCIAENMQKTVTNKLP